jgi:adenylate cyclase
MARILLATPEGQQVVELRDHNSLGRHPSNTIQLLDKIVSKEHCILEQRDGGFILRDLGSLNGTYVNRRRIEGEEVLEDGDELQIGKFRLTFLVG